MDTVGQLRHGRPPQRSALRLARIALLGKRNTFHGLFYTPSEIGSRASVQLAKGIGNGDPSLAVIWLGGDGQVDSEQVSRDVYELLSRSRIGTVVAVWADGAISAHRQLGFRYRSIGNGLREAPLTPFVSSPDLPSAWQIRERIDAAITRQLDAHG
jgi:hypothetical protein